jgi:flagellar motility protein MotE (MotC chaperone)
MRVATMASINITMPTAGRAANIRAGAATLLPAPMPHKPDTFGGYADPLAALYEIMTKRGEQTLKEGKTDVDIKKNQKLEQVKKELEANQKAHEEHEKQHGFWGTLKSVATVVATVASAVAGAAALFFTGGAAAPLIIGIAALVLSTGGAVVAETGVLGKDSKLIGMIMEGAGLCVGGAGSIAGLTTTAASAASSAATIASDVKTAATVTQGASLVAKGTSTVELSRFAANEEDARADALGAQLHAARVQHQLESLLEWMTHMQDSNRDTLQSIQGTIATRAKTSLSLTTMGGRA